MNCDLFFLNMNLMTKSYLASHLNPFKLCTVIFFFESTFQNFSFWHHLSFVEGDKVKTTQDVHKSQECDIFLKPEINDLVLSSILS